MKQDARRPPKARRRKGDADLERGREAYGRGAWEDAFRQFSLADRATALEPADLERLAWSAALTGRDDVMLKANERLYHAQTAAKDRPGAARAAFWVGFRLFSVGERGRAAGWIGRAERIIDSLGGECAERGYVLLPAVHRQLGEGNLDAAMHTATTAASIGERFGERDLVAFATALQGMTRLRQGRIRESLALLDEAMVAASSGEVSPIITGLIYCTSIDCCHRVYALGRLREWTQVLSEWCAAQPQLVTFTGACLVHRAEVMELRGDWEQSIEEARRATGRIAEGGDPESAGAAYYQQAEIHRLRGEFDDADEAYRSASRFGREPQPGLALLRLAQGQGDTAARTTRRVMGAAPAGLPRARFLPAHVEIMLATGDVAEARRAVDELESLAEGIESDVLAAIGAHGRGAVRLAEGDPGGAIDPLRRAFAFWHQIGAPFIAARIRVVIGTACRAMGDEDGAALEFEAARSVFETLGARPDLRRLQALRSGVEPVPTHGLTARELQVLRLVAAGKTNKVIAGDLFVSERTIDRHVSNIFNKLGVSSRAAATAQAYEQRLV
jgi:DNA-binding CsgD family transcriptional regulator